MKIFFGFTFILFTLPVFSQTDSTKKSPPTLEKGDYSVLGVLDFGSKTELEGAELQLKIE
ncbi:MAG: hypothetical protein HY063_06045 [Bacteroidetes bacterium]|nr:hypothetical protein [Bacteroidota bacterium]